MSYTNFRHKFSQWNGDKSIKIWNLELGICNLTLYGLTGEIGCVIELSVGKFAIASEVQKNKVWVIKDKECVNSLKNPELDVNFIIQISDDIIASSSFDQTIKVWRISNLECILFL